MFKQTALLFALLFIASSYRLEAQRSFPVRCEGRWQGLMYIFAHGKLKDSVQVQLTVTQLQPGSWRWKTQYLSDKMPMTKDYKLVTRDTATGRYITDEGDGIELSEYLIGDKMYAVFETGGVLLTSSYELRNDELVFEVSSGKKEAATTAEVMSYPVDFLQRVVFRRIL